MSVFASVVLALAISGCSTCSPVLYPNQYYKMVGKEQANKDVKVTIDEAKKDGYDDQSKSGKDLGKSAVKTAAGVGVNTGLSFALGGFGIGGIISAAIGGTSWLLECMFTKKQPDSVFKQYVETRLTEKGYKVIGWQ
ncbi:MAG: hypothetical protein GY750_01565 [Lentisphaerae bacterium]|nr:hypothetical protein [Lentisphaerota bacterium]MCP4100108.1 hypothetical protein [Lentisphaerota bacterium]